MRITLNNFIIVLLMLTVLVGCTANSPSEEATLYVAAPMSGFQANGGQTVVGGVRLRAEEINRAGGVAGYKVNVVALDDESDPDVALAIASEVKTALEQGDKILGFIGHYNSGETLAAMEVYDKLPLLVITPNASNVELTRKGYDKFFRIVANDAVQAEVDADFLVNELSSRRIAILYNDTAYGKGLYQEMLQALERKGAEVILALEVAEAQDRFQEEVTAIGAAGPDAMFYAGYEIEAPYLRGDLADAGLDVPMLASDGAFLSATIDEAGGAAEGLYVSAFGPSPETVADASWIEAYQAVEYRNPDTYSINGYAAADVLLAAIEEAGNLNTFRVAEILRQMSMDTLMGSISYDAQGDRINPPIYVYQVRDSAFEQVWP